MPWRHPTAPFGLANGARAGLCALRGHGSHGYVRAMHSLLRSRALLLVGTCLAGSLGGCSSDDATSIADVSTADGALADSPPADLPGPPTPDVSTTADAPAAPSDTGSLPCDANRRPIVLAHGFLASGDTFTAHFRRFVANGYCADRLFAFDWNTLSQDGNEQLLDAFVDRVLADTGAAQIDLGGHSAGGGLGYRYLAAPARAAKVAHYAHIASSPQSGPAGAATLNVWSDGDTAVAGRDIPGATNVSLSGQDHYETATSPESFTALYSFFMDGEAPETTDWPNEAAPIVGGRVLSLGENIVPSGAAVAAYETDPATGTRLRAEPDATWTVGDDGRWGPLSVTAGGTYELVVTPTGGEAIPVHYYREATHASSDLVYLRTLPDADSLAGALLASVPFGDDHAVMISFTSSQAVVAGRDTMTVGDLNVATEALASADQTTIALFMWDDDGDGETDGDPISTFSLFPFLNGVDAYFSADPAKTIPLTFNGRVLNVRTWPSGTHGAVVAVFD